MPVSERIQGRRLPDTPRLIRSDTGGCTGAAPTHHERQAHDGPQAPETPRAPAGWARARDRHGETVTRPLRRTRPPKRPTHRSLPAGATADARRSAGTCAAADAYGPGPRPPGA